MLQDITPSKKRSQEEKYFWDARNRQVFDLIAAGKTPKEVAIITDIQEKTVYAAIANKFFERQMKAYINAKLYEFQIRQVLELPKTFEKLRGEFENRLGDIKPDKILEAMLKLLLVKVGKTTLTKNMVNIIMGEVLKKDPKEKKDGGDFNFSDKDIISDDEAETLKQEFGYTPPGFTEVNEKDISKSEEEEKKEESIDNKNSNNEQSRNQNIEVDKGNGTEDKQEVRD